MNDHWRCDTCDWEGSIAEAKKSDLFVRCPNTRCLIKTLRIVESAFEYLATTDVAVSRRRRRVEVEYHGSRDIDWYADPDIDVWAFTDGSSTGSCAAVLINRDGVSRYVRHARKNKTLNVAAEIAAVALALKHSPPGSSVMVVSDFLGTAMWLAGHFRLGCPHVALRLRLVLRLIRDRYLRVGWIHHGGHQDDPSDFTRWNNEADRLCGTRPKRNE